MAEETMEQSQDAFAGADPTEYLNNSRMSKKAIQFDYRNFMARSTKLIHTPKVTQNIIKSLSSGNPVVNLGNVLYTVVSKVTDSINKSGKEVPDEVIAVASGDVMGLLTEVASEAGIDIPQDEVEAAFSHAVSKYMSQEIKAGRIDPKKLAEEQGRSVAQMNPEQRKQIDMQLKRIDETARNSVDKYNPMRSRVEEEGTTGGLLNGTQLG